MALTSVFYDGPVTETDRAANRTGAPDYGVYGKNDFKVKPHPSIPNAVLVTAGRAHGWGITDTATTDQVVQCGTITSGTRWDTIVVRRNWQPNLGGPSTLEVLPGGITTEIPASRKVGPGVEDDQPIAMVRWQAGLSAPREIIDLRTFASNGGMEALNEVVLDFMGRPGTCIKIGTTLWRYTAKDNGIWQWDNDEPEQYAPLQPSGFTASGNIIVQRVGRLKQVNVDITITRAAGASSGGWNTDWTPIGTFIPAAARGGSGRKYVPVSLSGVGVNEHCTLYLDPPTGALQLRGLKAFSFYPGALFSVNLTYYI